MLLGSSHPRDDLSIKRVGAQIPLWPTDLPSRLCVLIDVGVVGGIGVLIDAGVDRGISSQALVKFYCFSSINSSLICI